MASKSDLLREKLTDITNRGMKLKAIALNVGVDSSDLSHFKNGRNSLKESDVQMVSAYLDAVVIPEGKKEKVSSVEKRVTKRALLLRRNDAAPQDIRLKKTANKRKQVSLDLLNELD